MSETSKVRVTVLMLTCDRPMFVERAIVSIIAQRFHSWELIVVHDGLNGEIAATMNRWVAADPRVRYFRRPEKGNIANAYNFGLARARGDYIAILDDDDYWIAADKLQKQVAFLDAHAECVGCGGGMVVVDPAGRELMRYLKHEHDDEIRRWALVANPMAHSTTMFRRQVAGAAVIYDESLAGFQDWDLWLRLGQRGTLYNFPELFTGYTMWDGSGSFGQQRANLRSAVRIIHRHRGAYGGLPVAVACTSAHFLYAHLPVAVRRRSFGSLSRLKKRVFGKQPAQPAPQLPVSVQPAIDEPSYDAASVELESGV